MRCLWIYDVIIFQCAKRERELSCIHSHQSNRHSTSHTLFEMSKKKRSPNKHRQLPFIYFFFHQFFSHFIFLSHRATTTQRNECAHFKPSKCHTMRIFCFDKKVLERARANDETKKKMRKKRRRVRENT